MPEADGLRPVLVIAGPTAVGKSGLAVDIAERVGAEIVSADSRQVYRGLDIGTAKPSAGDLERVPHHLLSFLPADGVYSAGRFGEDVTGAISAIQAFGKTAVVVGGSTLYVEAIVRGLADLPPLSEDLQDALTSEVASEEGRQRLYAELAAADPDAAATLDPTKSQRLARLVGVLRLTGRPPSRLWEEAQAHPIPHVLVVLDRPRAELYDRIERRVDGMVDEGLVEEVRSLYDLGEPVRATLRATIGYREIAAAIEGEHDLQRAVDLIKRNSRRYAKRQLTWYRRYPEAVWLDARTATAESVLTAVAPWPESR